MRAPKLIETAARHMLHRVNSTSSSRRFKNVGVENTDDVWMFDMRQQNCLAERFLDFIKIHSYTLKNLHSLTTEKTMFYAIYLRKRPFTKEAFHFVGFADHLAVFKQAHGVVRFLMVIRRMPTEKHFLNHWNASFHPIN